MHQNTMKKAKAGTFLIIFKKIKSLKQIKEKYSVSKEVVIISWVK